MNQVTAVVTLDQAAGTIKFALDLQGDSPLDHELLAAAISQGRDVHITPTHKGDELFAEIVITDPMIWPRAVRALTNRNRIANNQPTIEEENFKRVESGAPTIQDEARDRAQSAHDMENDRRIAAGIPTLEEEEDNRNRAAFDEENRRRAVSGMALLTNEDYDRAKAERIARSEADEKATYDAYCEADAEFKKRHDAIAANKPKAVAAAAPAPFAPQVRQNWLPSPAADKLSEKTVGEDVISDEATRNDPRPQSLKEAKDRGTQPKS